MRLTEYEQKYLARVEEYGELKPEGKRQTAVCESLVRKGLFVRTVGGYSTPALVEQLCLSPLEEVGRRPEIGACGSCQVRPDAPPVGPKE